MKTEERLAENLAKFYYDVAKISFGSGVLSAAYKSEVFAAVLCLIFTGITAYIAIEADRREE